MLKLLVLAVIYFSAFAGVVEGGCTSGTPAELVVAGLSPTHDTLKFGVVTIDGSPTSGAAQCDEYKICAASTVVMNVCPSNLAPSLTPGHTDRNTLSFSGAALSEMTAYQVTVTVMNNFADGEDGGPNTVVMCTAPANDLTVEFNVEPGENLAEITAITDSDMTTAALYTDVTWEALVNATDGVLVDNTGGGVSISVPGNLTIDSQYAGQKITLEVLYTAVAAICEDNEVNGKQVASASTSVEGCVGFTFTPTRTDGNYNETNCHIEFDLPTRSGVDPWQFTGGTIALLVEADSAADNLVETASAITGFCSGDDMSGWQCSHDFPLMGNATYDRAFVTFCTQTHGCCFSFNFPITFTGACTSGTPSELALAGLSPTHDTLNYQLATIDGSPVSGPGAGSCETLSICEEEDVSGNSCPSSLVGLTNTVSSVSAMTTDGSLSEMTAYQITLTGIEVDGTAHADVEDGGVNTIVMCTAPANDLTVEFNAEPGENQAEITDITDSDMTTAALYTDVTWEAVVTSDTPGMLVDDSGSGVSISVPGNLTIDSQYAGQKITLNVLYTAVAAICEDNEVSGKQVASAPTSSTGCVGYTITPSRTDDNCNDTYCHIEADLPPRAMMDPWQFAGGSVVLLLEADSEEDNIEEPVANITDYCSGNDTIGWECSYDFALAEGVTYGDAFVTFCTETDNCCSKFKVSSTDGLVGGILVMLMATVAYHLLHAMNI